MEEKKPLVYRIKINTETPGRNSAQEFSQRLRDEVKAFAALSQSMRDELMMPFPKGVADAMLQQMSDPLSKGLREIEAATRYMPPHHLVESIVGQATSALRFMPTAEELTAWQKQAETLTKIAERSMDEWRQVTEAESILGIDHSKPETVEPWLHIPTSLVVREAQQLKAVQEQTQRLTVQSTLTLLIRSLDDLPESAEDELLRLLEARRGRNHKRGGGPRATPLNEQLRIVKGWLRVMGRINKETYAASQGIDQSTLYRWEKSLEKQGLL